MLRDTLLYLSNQPKVFKFVRGNRLAKHFARRFVAGETIGEARAAGRARNAKRITASRDPQGESVSNDVEARAARDEYLRILDRIRESKVNANVSVKLTAMGLDIDHELCVGIMQDILTRAQAYDTFVRIDMESSDYTDITLKLFEDRLYPTYKANVGVVLQSYLYRTFADVEHMNSLRARVRICKGAYKEPVKVAYPDKKDVDANYIKCMRELMLKGNYPGVATHDPAMIAEAKRWAKEQGITPDRFEFQMLYGVRRDLQEALVKEGWRVRCYVPFGTQWYPYLMRRLAERPANVAFITGNVIREALHRRK
jgi:proline dehydrogenase